MESMAADAVTRTWGPTQVHASLCEKFQQLDGDPISLRSVQAIWPRLRDTSEEWTLKPDDPDPAFVLKVLAVLAERVGPNVAISGPLLTVDFVPWLRVVHKARPDLEPGDVLRVAALFDVAKTIRLMGQPNDGSRMGRAISIAIGGGGDSSDVMRRVGAVEREWLPEWAVGPAVS